MDSLFLTYIFYIILGYVIWVIVSRCMNHGSGNGSGGGCDGDGESSGDEGGDGESGGESSGDEGGGDESGGDEGGDGESGGDGGGGEESGGDEGGGGESGGDGGGDESGGDEGGDGESGGDGGGGDEGGDGESGGDAGTDEPDNPGDGKDDGNLLRNNCGQEQLKYWTIMSNKGSGWKIEGAPEGSDALPQMDKDGKPIKDFRGFASCFSTSSGLCMKEQLVDLEANGFNRELLDKTQPPIEVSEWYACHADCGGMYILNVTLLDENKRNAGNYVFRDNFSTLKRKEWYKVTHTFSKYGEKIRYVSFNHGGMSAINLTGNYGSKMSGGVIRVLE